MESHKTNLCRKYKGNYKKKQIVACRKCRLKRECRIFMLYLQPDLVFINLNLTRPNNLS